MRRFGGFGVKPDYYRNKNLLGELTLGDLLDMGDIQGDFTIGENWLPITRVRRLGKGPWVGIFMYAWHREPDVTLPRDSRVRIRGNEVEILGSPTDPRMRRVRIKLEVVPPILEGSGPAGVMG